MAKSNVQSKSHHHLAHVHLLTNVSNNFLCLIVSEIHIELYPLSMLLAQLLVLVPTAHPKTICENNTTQCLKGIWTPVKNNGIIGVKKYICNLLEEMQVTIKCANLMNYKFLTVHR